MPSDHMNNRNRQCYSEVAHHHSTIHHNNNGPVYQTCKLTSIALLVSSASLVLAGCQSSPAVSSNASVSSTLMDFSVADAGQSQRQGRAFTASQNAQAERYAQLFDQDKYPSTENQAKSHLLTAIRQHLATEHVAVTQANYQSVPFIDADSIDTGASSLLRTIIETYAYQPESAYIDDYNESGSNDNDESDNSGYDNSDYDESNADDVERRAIAAILAEAGENEPARDSYYSSGANDDTILDEDGYDVDGYDEYGYDRDGYDHDGYNEYGNERESRGGLLSGMNPKTMAAKYEAMQLAKQRAETEPSATNNLSASSTGLIGNLLSMFHRTPEQIAATNAYQYQNLTFNSVSQYHPKQRQLQSVYSYDYVTPTISASIQIPLAFDFNNSNVTVDPSAIMPIVALANPEHTPLPTQMASHTVRFGLPESITAQLPPAVLYDAVLNAIQSSMAELAPEHFSAVDISGDAFAKEVGATRAVKVYFGSQQSGEMIGKTLKYVTQSLQEYVDANPNKYPDSAVLKAALAKIQLYNKGYQSADVGSLLQLIEAIGPISFNQINYYYLDSSDRLLAKQQRVNIGGDLMGSTTTMLNQVRYDKASFNRHALTPLLTESFGANAVPSIDGNAWIAEQRQQKDRLQTARYVRYDYEDGSSIDDYSNDEYDRNHSEEAVDESDVDEATDAAEQ
ncbi:hypothetical protein [Psychrobacter sp. NG27]|uniref:hypothetical protein n=1 Tax=Psychrobacter sp. NG27 TaxID=2781966 RepID=UPI0018DF9CF7|nr:hypothetical protein [Psychrobacter sp. NG27]MBI0425173.1 hypothetical protein [Psychrobacter sp. NG27]